MIQWNPDPILLEFGFLKLRWYSLMFLIGFVWGWFILKKIFTRENKPLELMDSLLVHVVLGTMIGARLGHCLFYDPDYYLSHPIEILKIWEGGLASHGGTAGVIIAVWMFSRRHLETPFMWILDRLSVAVPMVAGLIRIGNLMNSEIIGKPSDVPWSFVFLRHDQIPRHPAQLYESFTYFALFGVTTWLYRRNPNSPRGLIFGTAILGIFTARIFLEFFKENQEPFEAGMILNMGQLLSIPFVIVSAWLVIRALRAGPPPAEAKAAKKKKR